MAGEGKTLGNSPGKLENDPISITPIENHRPFGEMEFQVSQIIERLEAGANARGMENNNERKESVVPDEPEKSSAEDVLKSIENLIFRSDPNDEGSWPLPILTDLGKFACLSHSIAAYASCLDRPHLQKLNTKINEDTSKWLTFLFRFNDYKTFCHYDHLEGLVKVTRMMLHYKYPRYLEDGGGALVNQLPSIYSSVASPLGVVQHLCRQLALPLACIRPVPVNTVFGSNQTMDVAILQKMIAEDVTSGSRIPLMVLADAGTTCVGHSDAIARLNELCRTHDMWLHLRGHTLAALAVTQWPNSKLPVKIADSVTLPLGTWLGIPGLPVITLYKAPEANFVLLPGTPTSNSSPSRESTLPLLAGLAGPDHTARRLPALPLWVTLKAAGKEIIVKNIKSAFESCALVWNVVSKMPSIRILSKQPGGEGGVITINDLATKPLNTTLLFDVAVPCVVFQFVPDVPSGTVLGRVPAYFDKLNSWLGQILQRDTDQIIIEICDTESYGVVLRYCPLESSAESSLDGDVVGMEQLDSFTSCLDLQLNILCATVAHKQNFMKLVEDSPVLRLVEMPSWAGLGGVRYVPEAWEALLTDQAKEELNNLNAALVDHLRAADAAFSLGEGIDGLVCVRFGMVTVETDIEELLNLVVSYGKIIEENSRVLDSMSEIVRKGIEAATIDLQRENAEHLWAGGVLRRVPVVGRVVDWWSPATSPGIRGRTLDLKQGTIESTENIYKYHMQIPSGTIPHGVSKAPPPAEVQTAIGEGVNLPETVNATHSRNSSHSSSGAPHQKGQSLASSPPKPAVISEVPPTGKDSNT